MRNAEGCRLGYGRVLAEHLIDLARRDLLATPVDDLLEPAGDEEEAVVIQVALIAGSEPAVDEGDAVGRGVVLVARDDVWTLDDHLTRFPGRQQGQVVGHDPDLGNRVRRGPAEPSFRLAGGRGLFETGGQASVMPYASTNGTPNVRSRSAMSCGGIAEDAERRKRNGCFSRTSGWRRDASRIE